MASLAMLFAPSAHAQVVRTGYTSIVSANSAKCLDIAGESASAGSAAVQFYCTAGTSQQWTVQNFNGSFRIIEEATGDCLVVSGGSASPGAALVQEPCSGVPSELWTFTPANGAYELVSSLGGLCASVGGASDADSAAVVEEPCSTAANFLWTFTSGLLVSSSLSVIEGANSGQCLVVSGSGTTPGTAILQNPCSGIRAEQWTIEPSGSFFQVVASNSGLCLSDGGNTGSGAALVESTCSATAPGELWTLTPVGGSYALSASDSGLCLTVPNASQTAGAGVVQSACTAVQNQLWSLSAAVIPSSWTGVTQLAVDPIAVGNLPNGQLVMWSANDQYSFEGDIGYGNGQTYTTVFDPVALTSSVVLVTNTGDDMFCPGTANLFDGQILVNGGDSSPKTSLYDPSTSLWTSDADMNIPRGYEADTVLQNGSVMTLGGSWSGGEGGKTAEIWTEGSGWTVLSGVPETNIVGPDPQGIYRGDNHLWLFAAPNGEVFHAGPSAQMNWITTSGSGTIISAGNRGNDPYAINGNAVLYDVGMIMKTGGAPAYQDTNAEANTYLIDINGGVGNVSVTELAPMAYPRAFSNGVVLPNGQVVIIGGQTYPVPFSDATAILIPEIWDPQTQVFRQLNPMQTPRVYHSTGILLNDGRVYEGGGGQCGEGCSANHFNTEILTPPYLLNADGSPATRPVITSATASVELGGTIAATTASPVVSFVLMRLSSTTHTVNNDQRRIPLQFQSTNGTSYVLSVPSNPGIVLPGNYWLFALNAQGVPSVAANVFVAPPPPPPGVTLLPALASLTLTQGASVTDTIAITDVGGFSGSVTLAASGLPAGVTASFGTNPATGSSVLTLAASATASTGSYTITIAASSGSVAATTAITLAVGSGNCTPTAITPYIQVNGAAWQQVATASVASGSTVNLGPQPLNGGSWSWAGPKGFTSTAREIDGIPLSTGTNTYVATYTNASACMSTETFAVTVGAAASFTLSSSPGSVSVVQGGSANSALTVTGTGGFTGSVTLAASGLPTGVTAAFGTNPTAGSSTVTFTASSTAPAGTSQITISGVSGSVSATAIVALTVGAPAPSFTLSPSAAALSVAQGASGADTIAIGQVNGFTGSVTLAATGLPAGVTASFGTNPATGSSVLTFTASATAAAGTSTVTVTGTSGALTASTTIALTVPAACTPTAITPYLQVNGGAWQTAATASVATGSSVNLGPQPLGGTWNWTGPGGFTSTSREIDNIPLATGSNAFTATYTNASACKSTQAFAITVTAPQSFTLSSSPASVSVVQGATGTSTVTVGAVNGFTGSVTLAATGLPAGVTASFGANPATGSSALTFTVGATATAGSSTVTITGTSGTLTASTTVTLTVNAAPSFKLSLSPASVTVVQGATGTSTVTVGAVNGFTGSVTLAATGLPAGVTASFGTNPATGSSVLTFAASATAAAGTSTVTVTGTSGALTASTTIALTVSAACTPTAITPYLQVNGGAWQQASTASVVTGSSVNFGPQPIGGTWSWTGPSGFTSTSREIDNIPLTTGSNAFTATYTNASACKSTQAFAITVTAPPPSFTLWSSLSSITAIQGASATSTITVGAVNGFTGSVTLAATGLPSGVTATFATNPATGSSVLKLTASSKATIGSSTVTITGTSGSLTASTTIALKVASGSCTATAIVPYLQVNGGAWQGAATASVASGASVNLGPQPLTGGSWSWAGPKAFTSTAREIDNIALSPGTNTYVATYTNSSGCVSTETFVVTE